MSNVDPKAAHSTSCNQLLGAMTASTGCDLASIFQWTFAVYHMHHHPSVVISSMFLPCVCCLLCDEEFALGIDPKSLHAMVLMRMVYNAVIWHSRRFLKHIAISVIEKINIMVV